MFLSFLKRLRESTVTVPQTIPGRLKAFLVLKMSETVENAHGSSKIRNTQKRL
jgi:hypothetical protein